MATGVLQIAVCPFVFFCPLYCLSFFDIRIPITPLISSNSSFDDGCHFWPLCCLSFFDLRILITPLKSSKTS